MRTPKNILQNDINLHAFFGFSLQQFVQAISFFIWTTHLQLYGTKDIRLEFSDNGQKKSRVKDAGVVPQTSPNASKYLLGGESQITYLEKATNRECICSPWRGEWRVRGSKSNRAARDAGSTRSPDHGTKGRENRPTPSTNHWAATLRRTGAKLSKRLNLV
jgi:hypothetical protein